MSDPFAPWRKPACHIVACLLVLTLSFNAFAQQSGKAPRPNILFIVTDDQGWGNIGYHNDEVRTPNMDKLCRMGVELDAHYVQPQCTPTRVALLTGRYPSRFGPQATHANNSPAFPRGTPTMADMFKALGYDTALMGKWHLGSSARHGPAHFGFDYSYGSLAGAVGNYNHRYALKSPFDVTWHRNGKIIEGYENGVHTTDLIAADAIRFVKQKRDKPFFLYLPFHAVHLPIYEEDRKWHEMNDHVADPSRRAFLAAASHLDDAIGQIIEAVKHTVSLENTLIIFRSDNAGVHWAHRGNAYPAPDPAMKKGFSSNVPLRLGKITAYEGGMRVPAFITWPGKLKPRKMTQRMHAVDWMPTLARLVQTKQEPQWDGSNVWPLLTGAQKAYDQPRTIYTTWSNRAWESLHHGDWKIVRKKGQPWQLFDLATDAAEKQNLADKMPAKVAGLVELYDAERSKDK